MSLDALWRRFVSPVAVLLTLAVDHDCPPVGLDVYSQQDRRWLQVRRPELQEPAGELLDLHEVLLTRFDLGVGHLAAWLDAALDRLSFVEAVRRHAVSLSGLITVTVAATGPCLLPPDVETAAYRIVTEALTNITRHANAHHAQVSITTDDYALRLCITDDGGGGADTGPPGVG